MRMRISLSAGLVVAVAVVIAAQVWAYPDFSRSTKAACGSCHSNVAGGSALTDAGKAFKADKKAPAAGTAVDYVGSTKCKMCHSKEYKAWQTTAHGSAYANLKKADAKATAAVATALKVELKGAAVDNDQCVVCHVTGFKLGGGFAAGLDSVKTAALGAVGCEACHGPGAKHVSAPKEEKAKFINKAVASTLCIQCHTAATSPKFNSEEYMKRGVHEVAAATK